MPEVLRNICESLALRDPVRLKIGDLIFDTSTDQRRPTTVYWDGELNVTDATLNAGIAMEHVTGKIACRGSCQGDALRTEPGHSPLVGNLLIQAIALGHVESLAAVRQVVRDSFSLQTFEPQDSEGWQASYERFTGLTLAT